MAVSGSVSGWRWGTALGSLLFNAFINNISRGQNLLRGGLEQDKGKLCHAKRGACRMRIRNGASRMVLADLKPCWLCMLSGWAPCRGHMDVVRRYSRAERSSSDPHLSLESSRLMCSVHGGIMIGISCSPLSFPLLLLVPMHFNLRDDGEKSFLLR